MFEANNLKQQFAAGNLQQQHGGLHTTGEFSFAKKLTKNSGTPKEKKI
jgi:hypothetical protein